MNNKTIKIEFPKTNLFDTKQYIEDNFIIDQISGRMILKNDKN